MRKLVALLAVAVVAVAIMATPAAAQQAQTQVEVTKTVITPKKTGTKRNPKGVKLSGSVRWTSEAGVEPPIITGATVFLPKQGAYNGGKYAKCSKATLESRKGLGGCPKKSIMGTAKGVAFADTVPANPRVVFVNGGAKFLYFYTTLYNPAFVQAPVVAKITRIKNPQYGYKVRITVPEVLQVVAGVPVALRSFDYQIGGKPYAKDYIVTTGCPKSKKAPFQLETFYEYVDGTTSSSKTKTNIACR